MKAKAAAAKFGELFEISKADWVREVTDASKSVCVVAHLYEDGIVECRVMEVRLRHPEYGGVGAADSGRLKWAQFKVPNN